MTHVSPRHSCVSGPIGPSPDQRGATANGRRAPAGPGRRGSCLARPADRQLHGRLHGRGRRARRAAAGGHVSAMVACSASMPTGRPSWRRIACWRSTAIGSCCARPTSSRSTTWPGRSRSSRWTAILFDLGLSSYQLADPTRGFSFAADAPPDMRFDEDTGLSALELIDRSSQRELAGILATFGEERRAGRIAKAILAARRKGASMTTADLAAVVADGRPGHGGADAGRIHPATRTFQALRIAVNREVEVLPPGLAGALAALRPGGRMAVISYHSVEDRIVKRFIARESRDCIEDPLPPVCTCGHRAQLRAFIEGRRHRRARTRSGGIAARAAQSCASPRSSSPVADQATTEGHQHEQGTSHVTRPAGAGCIRPGSATSASVATARRARRPQYWPATRCRHRDRGGPRLRGAHQLREHPPSPRDRGLSGPDRAMAVMRRPTRASRFGSLGRARPRPRPSHSLVAGAAPGGGRSRVARRWTSGRCSWRSSSRPPSRSST